MIENAITVDAISFGYGSKLILKDISFSIPSSEILMLMGLNGCGKTTLINCIMGFLNPQNGNIYVNGNNISALSNNERAHLISYVPQDVGTNCGLNVLEYLSLGRIAYKRIYETANQSDYDCVYRYSDMMEITRLLDKKMNELSGGERQLVAITKSLIQETPVIVFDEPMAALDYKNQVLYLKVIEELRTAGKTVLLSSHNPNHALALNASIALIHNNSLAVFGKCSSVLSNDTLQLIYGPNIKMIDGNNRKYCVFDL